MPARETQSAHPGPSHVRSEYAISSALMPSLVQDRSARRDALLQSGSPGVILYNGPKAKVTANTWAGTAALADGAAQDQMTMDDIMRSRHCIVRMLAEHFIVPLSHVDGPTMADIAVVRNYEIADVLSEIRIAFEPADNLLMHRFPLPPQDDMETEESHDRSTSNAKHQEDAEGSFEATTLDIWLAPRLLSAAAMLTARCAELQDPSNLSPDVFANDVEATIERLVDLQTRISDLLHVLLMNSALVHGAVHVKCIFDDFLTTTRKALAITNSEGNSPKAADGITFYASMRSMDDQNRFRKMTARSKVPMTEAWLPEDSSPFEVPLISAISSSKKVPNKRSFFYAQALLLQSSHSILHVNKAYAQFSANSAGQALGLLQEEWQRDLLACTSKLPRRPLPLVFDYLRSKLTGQIAEQMHCASGTTTQQSSTPLLFDAFQKTYIRHVVTDAPDPRAIPSHLTASVDLTFRELRQTVRSIRNAASGYRKLTRQSGSGPGGSLIRAFTTSLRRCLGEFVGIATEGWEHTIVEASAMQPRADDRLHKGTEMIHKQCAFEGILLILQNVTPLHVHSISGEVETIERLVGEDLNGTAMHVLANGPSLSAVPPSMLQDVEEHFLLSRDDRVELIRALQRLRHLRARVRPRNQAAMMDLDINVPQEQRASTDITVAGRRARSRADLWAGPRQTRPKSLKDLETAWDKESAQMMSHGPEQLFKAVELIGRAFCAASHTLFVDVDDRGEAPLVQQMLCSKCDTIRYDEMNDGEPSIDSGSDTIRRCCSKAAYSTVLRLLENVATTLPSNEKAAPLLDGVRRCFAHGGENMLLDHALRPTRTIIQKGLRHVTEAGRAAAIRLCTVVVRQACASHVTSLRSEIMEVVEAIVETALVYPNELRFKMTRLHLAFHLSKIDNLMVQQRGLTALTHSLGSPDIMGDFSVDFLLQITAYQRKSLFQILQPHLAAIIPPMIAKHANDPKDGKSLGALLRLLDQNLETFIRATMDATVPVLVADADMAAVDLVAKTLGTSRPQLCLDTLAPSIISHILLKPAKKRDEAMKAFIKLATDGTNMSSPSVDELLRGSLTEALGNLIVGLGNEKTKANARDSLIFIDRHLLLRKSNNKSNNEAQALSAMLTAEILPLQHWLSDELLQVHGKRTIAQLAAVIRGMGALVEVAGQGVVSVRPQILTGFTSALPVRELRLDALRSWYQFFTKLPIGDVAPVVGQTTAVMLDYWPQFAAPEKEVATQILRYAILVHENDLGEYINTIPSLDALETEIPDISRRIRSQRMRQAAEDVLDYILQRVGSENASISYHSLLDLFDFLTTNRSWIESLTSGTRFGSPIRGIVSAVLAAASRIEGENEDARRVCLRCLGVLGAIDPDRFEHSGDEQTRIILKDFDDREEAIEFGVYAIQNVLVSAFRHAIDANAQQSYAYSIQEMLKYCGLAKSKGDPPSVASRQRWNALPQSMMDTLTPLANSRYKGLNKKLSQLPAPFYKHTSSFRKWIVHWADHLAAQVVKPSAKAFFNIVAAAITENDILVAKFMLPHLVLHLLIAGPGDRRSEIRSELVAVLDDQVDENSITDGDRRQHSAQFVFSLLDHLNIFIRRKRLETIHKSSRKVRQPEISEALVNVESIIASIKEELMARASMRCKSYARALLAFENRVRVLKKEGGKTDGDLQDYYANMHEIYANVDEPDGMKGVSTRIVNPTLEHQIREHEMTGQWTSAQSCWEVKLQQEPESLESQLGLLRCLRSLGHFDNLRTHIRGILTRHPEWRNALAAFTLESAWSLGEWDDVADEVQHTEDPIPEHGIGKAFLSMREDDAEGFRSAVQEARDLVGRPIFSAGSAGYPLIVDSVTKLHMLHELEMIQAVPKDAKAGSGRVTDLLSSLRSRLQSSVPSFRSREALLSLRRSAFGVRADIPDLVAEVGRCWTTTSKIARKAGHVQTAYSAVLQAIREKAPFAFVQNAKLLASNGEIQHALREVETTLQSEPFRRSGLDADTAGGTALNAIDLTDSPRAAGGSDSKLSAVDVAKACLLRARLMELTGRFESNEVIARYKQSSRVDSKAEKSWYFLGRYYDSLRDAQMAVPMQHKGLVVRFFLKAAHSGTKYFYRTMPRIATIWLDAGEEPALVKASKLGRPIEKSSDKMEDYQKQEIFQSMNERIRKLYAKVPAYQWYGIFPQLVSRIIHKNEAVWQVLQELIAFVVRSFPEQAMWSMVAGAQSKERERSTRVVKILDKVKADAKKDGSNTVESIVDRSMGIALQLLNLCELNIKNAERLSLSNSIPDLGDRSFRNLLIPLQDSIVINLPTDFSSRADHQGFPSDAPRIRSFEERIEIMASLQKPRKIGIKGTDGRVYNFLCKPKDDLRKDARLMEFDSMINKFLQANAESRRRRLHIRTYAVVTLNEECGFIEWVPNTIGFRNVLTTLYASKGISLYTPDVKPLLDEARLCPDSRRTVEIFETRLLPKYPPVFHEWFLATFSEPSAWMKARLSFARTAAVMSMVGWVLGLGDRHGENILFDMTNGDTVHVDFNCLFEKGQTFEIPEKVPFRLTQNMVDALGVTGVEGVFRRACEITMNILRENKDSLMSVLDAMIHDPLVDFGSADEGRRKRHSSTTANGDRPDPRVVAARQNLAPIERKLEGFIVSKLDTRPLPASLAMDHGLTSSIATGVASGTGASTGHFGGTAHKGATSGYPTNELVDMLIREATSSLLLCKMYVGWAPYL
ncbi:hypothetical protein V8E36_003273 [Tilletia maclaganii]